MSLPYFTDFGWQPYVLAVAPGAGQTLDPLLLETIPPAVIVKRVRAIPAAISTLIGFGNAALRALPFLYMAGAQLIARYQIDLVYFSTTMSFSMPLGRVWRRRSESPTFWTSRIHGLAITTSSIPRSIVPRTMPSFGGCTGASSRGRCDTSVPSLR